MPCVLQGSTDAPANQTIEQPSLETDLSLIEPQIQQITEVAWVDDDVEYVGQNDEDPISDSSEFEPDSDIDYMKKHVMNMFMNLMHHHLPLQNQKEKGPRKMSL